MTVAPEFLIALVGMALSSLACRVGGYMLMRFVRVTPRVNAALRAIPIGVMVGIVAPTAASGRIPELVGLGAVVLTMRLVNANLVAALAGVATVALMRLLLG